MPDDSKKPKSAPREDSKSSAPSSSSSSSSTSSSSSSSPPTNEMPEFPPGTTMWTAPQSLANPSAPAQAPQPHFLSRSNEASSSSAPSPEQQQLAREQRRQATYFRRVTGSAPPVLQPPPSAAGSGAGARALPISPMGPKPSMFMRWSHLGSFVLSVGLGGWMVLFCDFGEREHVFSPIRRAIFGSSSLRISRDEEAWLQRGFKTRTPLPATPAGESSSSSSSTTNSGLDAGPTLR
ncbi:hypothetical protein CF327_g4301 [Tilletia walkeri]|uniref:Uncharacterized protein n=1 Tax=Tilletia walkeri TaxID=117179 RepID=A0A8X7NAU4_9BASI|nr:hypothetical protein CF327_g4301 [Tilletia walkeri]KAE8269612.1 hypothetical protein A4X09_0g2728 [Tilletia walkeri]